MHLVTITENAGNTRDKLKVYGERAAYLAALSVDRSSSPIVLPEQLGDIYSPIFYAPE